MIDKELIESIVEDSILGQPLFLVEVLVNPGNIIKVEIDSEEGVSIEDCVKISRMVESQLNRDEEDFELEVGSSGITSPFKILRQYQKNIGNEVEVLGKKGEKLTGILKSCNDDGFVITVSKMVKPEGSKRKVETSEDLEFKYTDVKHTKYLIRFK